jgi:arylsulfatase A
MNASTGTLIDNSSKDQKTSLCPPSSILLTGQICFDRGRCFWILLAILHTISTVSLVAAEPAAKQLNVLLILADDLGFHDVGCYGSDLIETPHIDQFARSSLQFHRAYSPAPVCTPTRASILTGKHPARLKMTIWSEGAISPPRDKPLQPGYSKPDLSLEEITLAEKFKELGYFTAMIGKWHLGDANHAPETQGFDLGIGGNHWGAPATYFYPYRGTRGNGEYRYVPHLPYGREGEYLTDRLTDETMRAIDFAQQQSQPFFVMLNHYAPHTPIEAKAAEEAYFRDKLKPAMQHRNPGYAAMIKSLDDNIGRLLLHLQSKQLLENTVVVFTSDNGGYIGIDGKRDLPVTSNWPLRSGKASLYEGGLRVPLFIHWPQSESMGQACTKLVTLTDLHPTLLRAATDQSPNLAAPSDAWDLSPLLSNPQADLERPPLFFHYPHYYHAPPTTPCSSILQEPWKLIYHYETGETELYRLDQDPQEQDDLARQEPQQVAKLKVQLEKWLRDVAAERPASAAKPFR